MFWSGTTLRSLVTLRLKYQIVSFQRYAKQISQPFVATELKLLLFCFQSNDEDRNMLYTFAIFGASFLVRPFGGLLFGYIGMACMGL